MNITQLYSSLISTALLLLVSAGFFATPLHAQTQGWTNSARSSSDITMRELIPQMSSGKGYSERYTFAVDLDGGGHIGIDFTISNLGISNGYGAASVRVNLPGQKQYSFSERVSRRNWSFNPERFALDIAQTRVEGHGSNIFKLEHRTKDIHLELQFENTIPMWRPGNGQISVQDGYYKFQIVAPRANVRGRVHLNGEWHEVIGTRAGYADHVATNLAPYEFAKRFSRFRHYNGEHFVIWREIQLDEKYGRQNFVWLMVGQGDQVIFEDANATIKFADIQTDASTGYRVPKSLQIDGKHGANRVSIVMRGDSIDKRDLLANYGRAARMIASAVSKPFQFSVRTPYSARIQINGDSHVIQGHSHFTMDFINP